MASKFRPIEEIKKDMAQMEMLVETDVQVWWLVGTISVYVVSLMTWETRRNGNQISDYIF